MSMLEYFTKKRVGSLPNLQGTLSNIIPSVAIESANFEVSARETQFHLKSLVREAEKEKSLEFIQLENDLKLVNWLAVLKPQQLPEGFQRTLKVLTKVPFVVLRNFT